MQPLHKTKTQNKRHAVAKATAAKDALYQEYVNLGEKAQSSGLSHWHRSSPGRGLSCIPLQREGHPPGALGSAFPRASRFPSTLCSIRPEILPNSPHLPALGGSRGGGVERGAKSRTRGEWVGWDKGNSLVNKQTPGAGAPQPSHPNTTSPSPWSRRGYPAELSAIHRPLQRPSCLFSMAVSVSPPAGPGRTESREGLETQVRQFPADRVRQLP